MNGHCPWCGRRLDRDAHCKAENWEHPALETDQRLASIVRGRMSRYRRAATHHEALSHWLTPVIERIGANGEQAQAVLLSLLRAGSVRVVDGHYFLPERGLG